MKRNIVVSVLSGLFGSALLLMVLGAAGIVGAHSADVRSARSVSRANEVSAATPLTSTFTYQGQLKNNGSLVTNPACQMAFRLYDDPSAGSLIGGPITTTVPVTNGLFTVGLNFGSAFDGNGRWLDIQVNCGGGFVTLTPRQSLTAVPYAFALPGLYTQPNSTSPNLIGGYSGNSVTSDVKGATIGGGGQSGYTNRVTDEYGTVSGGRHNQAGDNSGTTSDSHSATVGGGRNNVASGESATVGGGDTNTADSWGTIVGGGRLNTASGEFATVGGGQTNVANGTGATVGGGVLNTATGHHAAIGAGGWNIVNGDNTTVSGGFSNTVSIYGATIGGGTRNMASGFESVIGGGNQNVVTEWYSTIGGGYQNMVSGETATVGGGQNNVANGTRATVGGGDTNTSNGWGSIVGGGHLNTASGDGSTIPGGSSNTASGDISFAAGSHAQALHRGAFVWADYTDANINSSGDNQFIVRANGGIWLGAVTGDYTVTNLIGAAKFIDTSTGAYLTTGGAWTNSSDRNAKANFTAIDSQEILKRVAGLPIQGWNYTAEDPAVRHIGPMAQDFYAAFNVGLDDTHISTIDEGGVALAAIQGLYQQNQELKAQIEALQNQSTQPASFNLFNLLSVIAFAGFAFMWLQQRRSKRGQA